MLINSFGNDTTKYDTSNKDFIFLMIQARETIEKLKECGDEELARLDLSDVRRRLDDVNGILKSLNSSQDSD